MDICKVIIESLVRDIVVNVSPKYTKKCCYISLTVILHFVRTKPVFVSSKRCATLNLISDLPMEKHRRTSNWREQGADNKITESLGEDLYVWV